MPIAITANETLESDLDATALGRESLVDAYLHDQADLTAVERFAQFHGEAEAPLQQRFYSALLPASPPGPGQQLAFEVDLDRCSGCKACVVACHTLNGLDEGESWREVGLIIGGTAALPLLQHVTTSCHHCLDPACLNACPVDAYEKDPITGIVKHLDDQCFGCQYCTLACPYDAPKFHASKGIVRKCDMCSDRLRSGEAPACVQACPHEAIRIRVVDRVNVIARAESGDFLATAPDPNGTRPTTRYLTEAPLAGVMVSADHFRSSPEHAHWPLVFMLVFTQLSAGGFLLDLGLRCGLGSDSKLLIGLSFACCLIGLAASTCHLGRPLLAYRALIGFRHSWLSREVAAFGLFAALGLAHTVLSIVSPARYGAHPSLRAFLTVAVAVTGLAGVASSVMVYHVVRRPFWRAASSGVKFAATTMGLGVAVSWLCSVVGESPSSLCRLLPLALMTIIVAKLLFEASLTRHLREFQLTPLRRSAELIQGPLSHVWISRLALGLAGGVGIPLALSISWPLIPPAIRVSLVILGLLSLLGGELAERYLFFAAVAKPKMPGGVLP